MLVTHHSFKESVANWWKECEVGGWGGFLFMKKFGYVKRKLREWNKSTFGHLSEQK